jgi:hypothetical protein
VPITEKQPDANRANAAKTGPQRPEGKARSARNARSHGFTASTFAVVRLEDLQEIAHLKTDLTAVYQTVNSQELFALERMALTQQAMLRAARRKSGLFTNCLGVALNDSGTVIAPLSREFAGDGDLSLDIEITRAQNRNYALAEGFHSNGSAAQQHLVAVPVLSGPGRNATTAAPWRNSTGSKALRAELPNEPILEVQPEENETACTPSAEPILPPKPNPEVAAQPSRARKQAVRPPRWGSAMRCPVSSPSTFSRAARVSKRSRPDDHAMRRRAPGSPGPLKAASAQKMLSDQRSSSLFSS